VLDSAQPEREPFIHTGFGRRRFVERTHWWLAVRIDAIDALRHIEAPVAAKLVANEERNDQRRCAPDGEPPNVRPTAGCALLRAGSRGHISDAVCRIVASGWHCPR
jgi:hypothetical protein